MKITFRQERDDGEVITFETAPNIEMYELLVDFERFVNCCFADVGVGTSYRIVPNDDYEEDEEEVEAPSPVWDWTVNELIKNAERNNKATNEPELKKTFFDNEFCSLCGIETKLMRHEQCYDTYCPKNNDAN